MAKPHAYTCTMAQMENLFDRALEGTFHFDEVPYEDFVAFLKEMSPNFKIQMGTITQEFKAELERLREIARCVQRGNQVIADLLKSCG